MRIPPLASWTYANGVSGCDQSSTARNLTAEIVGIDPTVLNDFYPPARAEMEYQGKVYGSVIETNAQAFKVNKDGRATKVTRGMPERLGSKVPKEK